MFQGPFDLLLFFIERDELDIYDIPIAKITQDFLSYLKHLEKMDIEVASEFILVAATLMRIKSKMLLPRPDLDEEGNKIDPKEELIKHLLEYKKYKSVVADLSLMEEENICREKRGNITQDLQDISSVSNLDAELQDLDLYKLFKAFQRVIKPHELKKNNPTHQITSYPYTIPGQCKVILYRLQNGVRLSFKEILEFDPNKIALIFNILAILEMLQLGKISIQVGVGYNNFQIEKKENQKEGIAS